MYLKLSNEDDFNNIKEDRTDIVIRPQDFKSPLYRGQYLIITSPSKDSLIVRIHDISENTIIIKK